MPQNEKDILEWYFTPSSMKSFGERIFTDVTKKTLMVSGKSLLELASKSTGINKLPELKKIDEIYWKFQNNKHRDFIDLNLLFTQREIRMLIWTLDYISSQSNAIILLSNDFNLALKLIQEKWKHSFLNTLWNVLAKNWFRLQFVSSNFNALTRLIQQHVGTYTGLRKDIQQTILNFKYFENTNSIHRFVNDLLSNSVPFNKSNEFLGQRESVLTYSYFSVALQDYLNLIDENPNRIDSAMLDSLYNFLNIHNNNKTTLITCSLIINSRYSNRFKEIIKAETIRLISDPGVKHRWTSSDLSVIENERVELARKKLNSWINKIFIEVFFEKLVYDERRKTYWLKFIDKIDDITFCGNQSNYQSLKNVQNISKQVDSRYKITSRNQNTCAIIIRSKDFIFVEFTDVGALYIYRKKSFTVNLSGLYSIDSLKIWSTDSYACKTNVGNTYGSYYLTNSEGRITHQGDWESRFDYWMRKHYD